MEFAKAIVLQLIVPLNLSLLCLFTSFLMIYIQRLRVAKYLQAFALGWILLCSQPYFSDLLLYPIEYHDIEQPPAESPDVIFVLACYYSTQGNVSEISRWSECSLQRNVEAARLHYQTGSPILVTGGFFLKDKTINYTDKTIEFFESLSIKTENLIGTRTGTTTLEEIESAKAWLGEKNVWVVSSATHIPRLRGMLSPIVRTAYYFPVNYQSKSQLSPYLTMPSQNAMENTRVALYAYLSQIKQYLIPS